MKRLVLLTPVFISTLVQLLLKAKVASGPLLWQSEPIVYDLINGIDVTRWLILAILPLIILLCTTYLSIPRTASWCHHSNSCHFSAVTDAPTTTTARCKQARNTTSVPLLI